MTIGAYIPLGAGSTKLHPRGVPYHSWDDCGKDMAAKVRQHGYRSAVVWMPFGREPPYDENGGGGAYSFQVRRVYNTDAQWMNDHDRFVVCWQDVRKALLHGHMWLYLGNLQTARNQMFVNAPSSEPCWSQFVADINLTIDLAKRSGFSGIAIDASGNAAMYDREYEVARMIRAADLMVGYEGWADDAHMHWKRDVCFHGFAKPQWWREDEASGGRKYGVKPLGGRSVLHLEGTGAARVEMAKAIIKSGCGVYDDIWHGVRPKDLEKN